MNHVSYCCFTYELKLLHDKLPNIKLTAFRLLHSVIWMYDSFHFLDNCSIDFTLGRCIAEEVP